jgi:hypothetical protein
MNATAATPQRYDFLKRFPDGSSALLGTAVRRADGWWFIPHVFGRKPSRVAHPTLEKCLPRWLGYPDRCESVAHPA